MPKLMKISVFVNEYIVAIARDLFEAYELGLKE